MSGTPPSVRNLKPLHVDPTAPLSRRTQLRLENMERFTRRVGNTSIGYDARSLAMESRVRSAAQLLVALLEEREQ